MPVPHSSPRLRFQSPFIEPDMRIRAISSATDGRRHVGHGHHHGRRRHRERRRGDHRCWTPVSVNPALPAATLTLTITIKDSDDIGGPVETTPTVTRPASANPGGGRLAGDGDGDALVGAGGRGDHPAHAHGGLGRDGRPPHIRDGGQPELRGGHDPPTRRRPRCPCRPRPRRWRDAGAARRLATSRSPSGTPSAGARLWAGRCCSGRRCCGAARSRRRDYGHGWGRGEGQGGRLAKAAFAQPDRQQLVSLSGGGWHGGACSSGIIRAECVLGPIAPEQS